MQRALLGPAPFVGCQPSSRPGRSRRAGERDRKTGGHESRVRPTGLPGFRPSGYRTVSYRSAKDGRATRIRRRLPAIPSSQPPAGHVLSPRLAYDGPLLGALSRIFVDSVLAWYRRRMEVKGAFAGRSGARCASRTPDSLFTPPRARVQLCWGARLAQQLEAPHRATTAARRSRRHGRTRLPLATGQSGKSR